MKTIIEKHYKIFITLMLGFMFVVSVLNARNDSAIFDETAHIGAGYSYVTEGEMRLNPEHPPLIKDLAGIPLRFLGLNFDVKDKSFWTGNIDGKWDAGQWEAGKYLLYGAGNDADRIIFWARFPIILISLLLGYFIFRWTRELAGVLAGLFALALYAFDPNILGHNHFVTTDIGIAAFITFFFYYFLQFIKRPSWKNVLQAGIFMGLVQLAKFSSLMTFPIFAMILVIYPLVKLKANENISRFRILGEYMGKGILIFSISMIIVWGVYAINTHNTSKETMAEIIDFNFPERDNDNVKNLYTNKSLHFLNENSITRPLSTYGVGIGYVFRRVSGGNGAYFLGQVSSIATPKYFPVVFLIKEPLVSLFLMLSALIISLLCFFKNIFRKKNVILSEMSPRHEVERSNPIRFLDSLRSLTMTYLRHNIASTAMFSFVVLYSYLSITGNLNIGLRHLFPIFPFIFILTAKIIFDFIKRHRRDEAMPRLYSIVLLILVLILIVQTISAYPSYMSYFNESVGGPKNGYKLVTDSNADWGQDLKRLKLFLEEHPEIKNIRVDYFGGGDLDYYLGENNYIKWWDSKRPVENGWYAISTNFLEGSIYSKEKPDEQTYRWLAGKKPVYQVGTSIFIYHITDAK